MEYMNVPVFLVLLALAALEACLAEDSDWPMEGCDALHTGVSGAGSEMALKEITLLCTYDSGRHITSPVSADVDGDGFAEILFGSGNTLYVSAKNCSLIWSYEAHAAVHSPAVSDLGGDGDRVILFGSEDGRLHALDGKGNELWIFQANGSIRSSPVSVNLDNDSGINPPGLETVFGAGDGRVYILDSEGTLIKTYNVASPVESTPSVGDINSNGQPDILVGSMNSGVAVYEFPGLKKWDYQAGSRVSPPVIQTKPEGNPGVVAASGDGNVYCLAYTEKVDGEVRKFDRNGSVSVTPRVVSFLQPAWSYKTGREITSSPIAVDLDRDENQEIVAGSEDKNLYIFTSEGEILHKHSVNGKILASPVAADLDGDGYYEIIFGSSDGVMHILNATGFRKWSYETKTLIDVSPALADLDRDGSLEIVYPAGNKLYVFGKKTEEKIEASTTTIPATTTTSTTTSSTTSSTTATTTTTSSSTTSTIYREPVKVGQGSFFIFLAQYFVGCVILLGAAAALKKKYAAGRMKKKEYKKDLWAVAKAGDGPKEEKSGLRAL